MTYPRGHKIHVRNQKAEDDEGKRILEELYDSSEFGNKVSKEAKKSAQKPADDELTDEYTGNSDIDDFLDAENRNLAEITSVKEKASSKKSRAKKEQRKAVGHKLRNALIAIFLLLVVASGGTFLAMTLLAQSNSDESTDINNEPVQADQIFYSRLTGLQVANEEDTNGVAICVMIENSLDARNQSGLSQAGVVYEAVAEGGITRFMAVYQDTKPSLIGPVRSIRLVYAHLAKQYNCSIAHVGGAQNALDLVRGGNGYRDIDQFFTTEGDYYWRANTRPNGEYIYAPHNVYTNFNYLASLSFNKGYNSSNFTGFSHVDADQISPVAETPINNITVFMGGNNEDYDAHFVYDAVNNNYVRWHWTYQNGYSIHYDLTGNGTEAVPITPKVVIAMRANTHVRDINGYFDYEVDSGQNDAYIFQNGEVIPAKWRRDSENDPLKFYDSSTDAEIKLERGQVWISVYPANTGSVNWN